MHAAFLRLERRARHVMSWATLALVLALTAYQMGWISAMPGYPYKDNAWYVQNSHAGVLIVKEYQDEYECQQNAPANAECRPGKALIEEANAQAARKS